MAAKVFFDTNVLVYAYDNRDAAKQKVARVLLTEKAVDADSAISTQVVQEFCNVCIGKLRKSAAELTSVMDDLLGPLVAHTPDMPYYKRALALQQRYSLAFHDALIVQAALDLGCATLYSEDLQDGQKFGGLTVKDPFAA